MCPSSVLRSDLDRHVIRQIGGDIHRREARMASFRRIEGGYTHKPVDPLFDLR